MTDRLGPIVERRRADVAAARVARPLAALREALAAAPPPRGFRQALARPGLQVIAEIKRRSPSAGAIREDAHPAELARLYQAAGAAALSILTETHFFGGTLDDLVDGRGAVALPVLRKDFTVCEADVYDARVMGADAVLLIVAALQHDELTRLLRLSGRLDLDALVEVHDEAELSEAVAAGAGLVGVNQRDLRTFEVDPTRAERVAQAVPAGVVKVAESGIGSAEDLARLAACGFDAVLVGESLVTAADPAAAVRALKGFKKG